MAWPPACTMVLPDDTAMVLLLIRQKPGSSDGQWGPPRPGSCPAMLRPCRRRCEYPRMSVSTCINDIVMLRKVAVASAFCRIRHGCEMRLPHPDGQVRRDRRLMGV